MQFTQNDIWTNVELINTYNVIIKNPTIFNSATEELELNLKSSQLSQKKIQVTSADNSQVVTVTATDENPVMARNLANTTVEVFQETRSDSDAFQSE